MPNYTNAQWATSNMVSSLLCADSLLYQHETIVSYGDIVYRSAIVKKLIADLCPLSITYDRLWLDLWKLRFDDPLDDAERFQHQDHYLQAIGDKVSSLDEIDGQYMGLIKICPQSWQHIKHYLLALPPAELQAKDMTTLLNDILKQGNAVKIVAIEGGWAEVDNPSDISCYEQQLVINKNWSHDWRE